MSGEDDFSGPSKNKSGRGPVGIWDFHKNARARINQRIHGLDFAKAKKALISHGRTVALINQMDPQEYKEKKYLGLFGYHNDLYGIVWVLDLKSGKYSREKIEVPMQNVKWNYRDEFFNNVQMLQFATPFEKRLKLIPIHYRSFGTAVVTKKGKIIGWVITVDNRQLFARSADLRALTKKGSEMISEISDQNMEMIFGSSTDVPEGEWESFNRIAPEAKLEIICGVHGDVLELLGANVPASAISEGLGPLDYIGYAALVRKIGARLISVAITKGTTTLARKAARISYNFRMAQPNVYSYDGRVIVVVRTSKGPQPFYKRTGGGGKNPGGAQAGDWAPYDGHMPRNGPSSSWMIKDKYTTNIPKTDPLFRWGTEEFKAVNDWLKRQNLMRAEVIPTDQWRALMLYFKGVGVKGRYVSTFE